MAEQEETPDAHADRSEATRFKPGNKLGKGRPKGSKNADTLAREAAAAKAKAEQDEKDRVILAWRAADLTYKLKAAQKLIHEAIKSATKRKTVLHCSRRFGKSFLLVVIAIMAALTTPGIQVSYICPTQKNLRTILKPIFREILKDCPPEFFPTFHKQEGIYIFPNGSEIHLFGVEGGNIENLRGQSTKLALVDEAGFIDNLKYVVDSVLLPQLLSTNGQMFLSSSSPLSKEHEFVEYINAAKLEGAYHLFTIEQAGYEPALVEEFIKEMGGRNSTQCRRELFCELVTEAERALCPEWKPEFARVHPRSELFEFYDKYFALDSGVRDKTVGLYGYYDFKNASLIIEAEFVLQNLQVRTDVIAGCMRAIEAAPTADAPGYVPGDDPTAEPVALGYKDVARYGDNDNLILIQDLTAFHDMPTLTTGKDSLDAMVNQVRLWVAAGRIVIHPRCKLLLATLENGLWNPNRTDFARSESLGHMDAFAALMYMVRNVRTDINPVPAFHNTNFFTHHIDVEARKREQNTDQWKNILGQSTEDEFNG